MARKYTPRLDWRTRGAEYFKRLKKRRQKFYYRCGRCRKRKVLARELWEYQIPPRCCRGVYWVIDGSRYKCWKNKTHAYALCYCFQGRMWDAPHKPGSVFLCEKSTATDAEKEAAWEDRKTR